MKNILDRLVKFFDKFYEKKEIEKIDLGDYGDNVVVLKPRIRND